jgi:sporulation protein YlmC with PRC-barrel domain
MPVVDLSSAHRVGNITDVFFDPNTGNIRSFDVGHAGDLSERRVRANDVRRIGKDAVVMDPISGSESHGLVDISDEILDIATIIGLEVIDEAGDGVGFVADALVNRETLGIDAYELRTTFWQRLFKGPSRIAPERILLCSREIMLVRRAQTPVVISVRPDSESTVAWREQGTAPLATTHSDEAARRRSA